MGTKFSELTENEALTGTELVALSQDIAATLTSVQATLNEVGDFFGEDATFVTTVVNNATFITELITELTTNDTFITELTENSTFIEDITNIVYNEGVLRTIVTAQASATYTLVLTDADHKWLSCTSGSVTTITIPQQSSVAWPDNSYIEIYQEGTGAVTVEAGAGVTLRVNGNLEATTNGQYAVAAIKRVALNEWVVFGNLVPL